MGENNFKEEPKPSPAILKGDDQENLVEPKPEKKKKFLVTPEGSLVATELVPESDKWVFEFANTLLKQGPDKFWNYEELENIFSSSSRKVAQFIARCALYGIIEIRHIKGQSGKGLGKLHIRIKT